MTRAILLTVLLVSTAHAFVHIFELALPSVEQDIARTYRPDNAQAGKEFTGALGSTWRLPFGWGALLAGILVDRFGGRRLLAIYLLGCGGACIAAATVTNADWLFVSMFAMGAFASIYHPAGLALISHVTTPQQLPRALGLHGIFGSLGIGGAPFLAAAVLGATHPPNWRMVYWVLSIPALALGIVFVVSAMRHASAAQRATLTPEHVHRDEPGRWPAYFTLTAFAVLMGFTYAGVLNFLPRYIDGAHLHLFSWPDDVTKNAITGCTLLVGCLGQYLAGRFARTDKLEGQLLLIALGNIPGLLAMSIASGGWRVAAAVLWSLIHFMHQPIYNSLIAKYTPRSRRSLCYGFSFAMGFGFGSFGAMFAGLSMNNMFTFGSLAGVVVVASCLCTVLWRWNATRTRSARH